MIPSIAHTKSKANKSRFVQLPSRGWFPYIHLSDYPTVSAIPLDPEKLKEAQQLYTQQLQLQQAQAGQRRNNRKQRAKNFKSTYVNNQQQQGGHNNNSNNNNNNNNNVGFRVQASQNGGISNIRKQQQINKLLGKQQQQQQQQQQGQFGGLINSDEEYLSDSDEDENERKEKLILKEQLQASMNNEPKLSSTKLFRGDIYHPPVIECTNQFQILDASVEDPEFNEEDENKKQSQKVNPYDHLPFLQSLFPEIEEVTLLILLEEAKGDVGSIVDSFLLASNILEPEPEQDISKLGFESSFNYNGSGSISNSKLNLKGDAVDDEDFEELLKELAKQDEENEMMRQIQKEEIEYERLEMLRIEEQQREIERAREKELELEKERERKQKEKEKKKADKEINKQQGQLISDFNATISHLTDLFPKYSKRDLTSYLDKHSYDVNATIDTLLSLETIGSGSGNGSDTDIDMDDQRKTTTTTTTITSTALKKPINNFPTTTTTTTTSNNSQFNNNKYNGFESFNNSSSNGSNKSPSFSDIMEREEIISKSEPKNIATYVGKPGSSLKNLALKNATKTSGSRSNSETSSPKLSATTSDREFSDSILPIPMDYDKKISQLKIQFPLIEDDILESFFAETNYNFKNTMSSIYEVFPESKHNAKSVSNFASKVRESSNQYYARNNIFDPQSSSKINMAPLNNSNSFNNSFNNNNGNNGKLNILPAPKKSVEIYSGISTDDTDFRKVEPRERREKPTIMSDPYYSNILGGNGGMSTLDHKKNQRSYAEHRTDAERYIKMRNACFKSAAEAYMKNKPADARALSEQGKKYDEMAKEANSCASNQIFMECNSRIGDTLRIDLHGLHVNEALDMVQQALDIHSSGEFEGKRPKFINFITGQGNHSQGGVARIKPALLSFLRECNIRFNDKGGMIEVQNF